jgi:hypothetical protein
MHYARRHANFYSSTRIDGIETVQRGRGSNLHVIARGLNEQQSKRDGVRLR